MGKLKIWTSNNFEGHYPVGTAAIVIANTAEEAAGILSSELRRHGLPPAKPEQMEEMEFKHGAFRVLCDGNY